MSDDAGERGRREPAPGRRGRGDEPWTGPELAATGGRARPDDAPEPASGRRPGAQSGRLPAARPGPGGPGSGAPPLEAVTPSRWTVERLLALDPHEYDFQEFKAAPYVVDGERRVRSDFFDNLSKQVSAFANAAGGRLFLGLDDEGRIDSGVPTDLRPGGTREWLEDVVPHLVVPRLRSLNVYEVRAPGLDARGAPDGAGTPCALTAGRAVYVLEIPKGEDAPYQARDHRYYLRIAGKSRPMGHHHVLDVLQRARDPQVAVSRIDPYGEAELIVTDPRGPKAHVRLRALLQNRGRNLAQHVGCEFVVPRFCVNSECRERTLAQGDARLLQRSGEVVFFFYHPFPIFPSQEVQFGEVWLAIHGANLAQYAAGKAVVRWRVYADAAPVREGTLDVAAFGVVQRGLRQVDAALRGPGAPAPEPRATSARLAVPGALPHPRAGDP